MMKYTNASGRLQREPMRRRPTWAAEIQKKEEIVLLLLN
jgi:hypothetical protein